MRPGKSFTQQGVLWRNKHYDVPLVEPFDRCVSRNPGADRVNSLEVMFGKKVSPIRQVLLVEVVSSALPGKGS